MTGEQLLDRILGAASPAFALLHRPETGEAGTVELLTGEVRAVDRLADLPLPVADRAAPGRHELLAVIPYRRIAERGFACVDDGASLLAMSVTDQATMPLAVLAARLPEAAPSVGEGAFDVDDDAYAELVRRVLADEIGNGEGANFVIRRTFTVDISDYDVRSALAVFRRLLARETGAYWTFIVHTGDRTFVGATPERHISLRDGVVTMTPISGTYRYPPAGPDLPQLLEFLGDRKETEELYMVMDEELKMMGRICARGGWVTGPYLREMTRLAHTEYVINGRTDRDVREILRETMFAPTVTGSPLESACRVIRRYEPQGRRYYSGVLALVGRDPSGAVVLDSAILIRTAEIDATGRTRIGVGATLVRHSDPWAEVAETRAKAAGLLTALGIGEPGTLALHPEVRGALARRNAEIGDFWLRDDQGRGQPDGALAGRQVLVVDAEDNFTLMLTQQLGALGLTVDVRRFDEPYRLDGYDLVVMGPGPGDPRDRRHPKIAHLRRTTRRLLDERRPFLSVCLSHQVLSLELGFDIARRDVPNQGLQREIDLFGRRERVGFYNTFAACSDDDKVECAGVGPVEVSRDEHTGEVHALRGPHFASLQFHVESVLTLDGVRVLGATVRGLVPA
ncbi:anthranilate synthase family protein [Micromonospora sp. NPDC051196]|uniref:anthranilate synthase family protein n=1 Tax=Micromonospora sp. NPDC051196 TaxID=3155281 RepID=UPI00342567F9